MAQKRYKRYSKRELVNKIRWDLKNRYNVPEDVLDFVDIEAVIQEGMTKSEGLDAVLRAYPDLRSYVEKKKHVADISSFEEDLYKNAELLRYTVGQAEKGDETAKAILKDLVRKAIVEGDKEAIEIIRVAYNVDAVTFANMYIVPLNILSSEELSAMILEASERIRAPLPPPKLSEYERLVKDVEGILDELNGLFRKLTLEDLKRIGYKGVLGIIDKFAFDIELKLKKLEELKKDLPEKEKEINSLIERANRNIESARKAVEGIKPVDIEQVLEKALASLSEKIATTFSTTFKKTLSETLGEVEKRITREIRRLSGEVELMDLKYSIVCYYGDRKPAVKYYENIAVCAEHAYEMEKVWESQGISPQWNPDDMGVCTNCGRLVKLFRGSGGLIYCLDCSMQLSGKIVFDDEIANIRERARSHLKRILEKYK